MERRDFIKNSALVGAGLLTSTGVMASGIGFNSGSDDALKIAYIGCGGRGARAVKAALDLDIPTELVSMCDLFKDIIDRKEKVLLDAVKDKTRIKVTEETKFTGFQGYKDAIALADVVFITTPAAFKPKILEECINQGKHVFMEKPVCVDSVGFQQVMAAAALAKQKKLFVAGGLQRRYSTGYQAVVNELHNGAIGDILSAECYWMGGPIGDLSRPRKDHWTEMEFQNRHWRSFSWVSGGNVEEYHVHNIDIVNWVLQEAHPQSVLAMGGKSPGKDFSGSLGGFDSLTSNFKYKNGVSVHSYSRNIPNCKNKNGEWFYGTKGKCVISGSAKIYNHKGKEIFSASSEEHGKFHGAHDKVQKVLMESIYHGKEYFNDGFYAAQSSMTGAFGRMSGWSGKEMKWDKAIESQVALFNYTDDTNMSSTPPILPDALGNYPVPTPGKTIVL
ncbi:Gfo/Idh/MocA family protein [Seonamhaeicola maritimus]|uniref:Gfo/Idh/MocA family oxidoreductase n=1 Tax=Seonamhaeicola maritimus TaxID=2591822 RepID=A0A5C7GFE5_9FLAO|nr:Gfo/Idh/MocA family oxidoreductase [Seonamhaeicola maritimus]TXG35464.1 Gfo/Idh/MocA family oxidoreductase [Seonamhaeicola maritimus]